MKSFFTCIDITLKTPQPEQLNLCRAKAHKEGGEISYYGAEEYKNYKYQPYIFNRLLESRTLSDVIFFTFDQFCYGDEMNLKLLYKIINKKYGIHFAREDISINNRKDLQQKILELLAYYHAYKRINKL